MSIYKIIDTIKRDKLINVTKEELEMLGKWYIVSSEIFSNIKDQYSGPIWGFSVHTLYCGDTMVDEWEVGGCGCYGPGANPKNIWGMESVNSQSTISDATKHLLDILEIEDPEIYIPKPEDPPDNPNPEGEWELWWVTTPKEESYIINRYSTQEEAKAICSAKTREFESRYPNNPMNSPLAHYEIHKRIER